MPYLVVDVETACALKLKEVGAWAYLEHPTLEFLSVVLRSSTGHTATWHPGDPVPLLWVRALREGWLFVAHNVGFEKPALRNVLIPYFGWPDVPNEQWHDTMASCAMRALPLNLEDASTVLRLAVQKDTEGSDFTIALSKPGYYDRRPETIARVDAYCAQDVEGEIELHERLGELPPHERQVWLLDQLMNERGVRIDLEYVEACQAVVDGATRPAVERWQAITGLEKLGSRKFLPWLAEHGIVLPNLQKETIAEALGIEDGEDTTDGDFEDPAWEALYTRYLVNSSSVSKLKKMRAIINSDGRARGLWQWHGTVPGRVAGRLINLANFPRPTLKLGKDPMPVDMVVDALMTGDHEYVATVIGKPIETVISGLRHAVIADPGKVLVSGDYAGIQARVVLALAEQYDKSSLMAQKGADIYCDMASQIYKKPINKKEHPAERQTGKNSVLGLGFGMGKDKFHFKYCKKQPLEFAERVVQTYRKEWAPKVPFLWYGLQNAAVATVWDKTPHEYNGVEYRLEDGWLTARVPTGGKIWYRNPQPCKRAMPWDETDIRQSFTYQAQKATGWSTMEPHGGLLTENAVMRIEADIKNAGLIVLEANGFPIVMDVYDELVGEVPEADADQEAFLQCMLDLPPIVAQLQIPIAVEGWSCGPATRYRK